jgi:carbon monoxide dehydrogenase subunit G
MLQDPAVLQAAIPGCQELKEIGEGRYAMTMKVALAALAGDFTGTVQLTDREPPSKFRMIVEASGRMGFLKGEGLLTVTPASETTTTVAYDGSTNIGGTIASVGQRLVDATAKMIIRNFFERFASACG